MRQSNTSFGTQAEETPAVTVAPVTEPEVIRETIIHERVVVVQSSTETPVGATISSADKVASTDSQLGAITAIIFVLILAAVGMASFPNSAAYSAHGQMDPADTVVVNGPYGQMQVHIDNTTPVKPVAPSTVESTAPSTPVAGQFVTKTGTLTKFNNSSGTLVFVVDSSHRYTDCRLREDYKGRLDSITAGSHIVIKGRFKETQNGIQVLTDCSIE